MTDKFWNVYQKQARSTAIYPPELRIIYPTLGLVGELGELGEKLQTWEQTAEPESDITLLCYAEVGDVLWYIANLATDVGVELDVIHCKANMGLLPPEVYFEYDTHSMLPVAAALCETVKKIARDKKGESTKEDSDKIADCLRHIMEELHYAVNYLNGSGLICNELSLEDVARNNLEKLQSRKERNVLHGSGDTR